MILTIKGADFSAANIGTLNTVIVRKSIGGGISHSIPNFVDKNSSVEWVLTLTEGYTFGTYSITMGGETITPVITETSMTITISSVTDNVIISVASINESTGEEELPETPSEDTSLYNGGWELGAISSTVTSSGVNLSSTTRVRTITAIDITNINNLVVSWDDSTYKVAYYYYNVDNYMSSNSLNTASYVETSPITLDKQTYTDAKYIRLVLAKKDDATMTVDEVQTSNLTLTSN